MPTNEMDQTVPKVEAEIISLLDEAATLHVELSEDDHLYDLNYIRQKLTRIGVFQEKLGETMMRLTRLSVDINRMVSQTKEQTKLQRTELRLSTEYREKPLSQKTAWLDDQLSGKQNLQQSWTDLLRLVSEVKGAVESKVGTMRRLDSDLRLHARLFEQGVAAGAVPGPRFPGSNKEIDDVDIS